MARSILEHLLSNFFSVRFTASMWCIHIVVWTRPQLGKIRFILSDRSDFHMTHIYGNNGKESNSMEKILKPSNPKVMNLSRRKVDV